MATTILTSSVPCAEQVDTAGEETSLEEAKNRTKSRKLRELFNETHANHDTSPEHSDDSQVETGTNSADEDSRGRLEDDVWDEEYQVGNVLSTNSSVQLAITQNG